jgi:molybdopterin-containing oxidoreductase family iron-sulfur binding subunit
MMGHANSEGPPLRPNEIRWLDGAREALLSSPGESLVLAGEDQSEVVHEICLEINARLSNLNRTVLAVPDFRPPTASLQELVAEARSGKVESLLILGGNPAYSAPGNLEVAASFEKVPFRLHQGLWRDETANLCEWHVPETHFLESWSDLEAWDGSFSIVQPAIAPLFEGRSTHELLAVLNGQATQTPQQLIRSYWMEKLKIPDEQAFLSRWKESLRKGVIELGSTRALEPSAFAPNTVAPLGEDSPPASDSVWVLVRPDPSVWDGRFANNPWLQELPTPITQLTWDNAVWISPAHARGLKLQDGDLIEVETKSGKLTGPVIVVPGQTDRTITIHLGRGQRHGSSTAIGHGFSASPILQGEAPCWIPGVRLSRVPGKRTLARTHLHHRMEGRDLIRLKTRSELSESHVRGSGASLHAPNLFPSAETAAGIEAWGMSIDLSRCIGCNACVIGCQAENNVPTVGKAEVLRGREMHWIRVDFYFGGKAESPRLLFQPVPCMHCETAPCEEVCPTAATNHSHDGLNQMVYNRCVGTRYCSNNCPYKVRRFNFFPYASTTAPILQLGKNPEVTVRSRGVMEKCTYCVQRIQRARIDAEKESRALRDGEIVPACAAACPTEAIVFGNLKDPHSKVSALRSDPRSYGLLEELGTRPRTTYLTRIVPS